MAYTTIPPSTGGGSSGGGGTGGTYDLATATGGIIIDGTGEPTLVPLLIKNGKPTSGIELQVTGTSASGVVFRNSAGVVKGSIGLNVAASDWGPLSAAGDLVITGGPVAGTEKVVIKAGNTTNDARLWLVGSPSSVGSLTSGLASLSVSHSTGTVLAYGSNSLTFVTASGVFAGPVIIPVLSGSEASPGNLDIQSTTGATKGLVRIGGATGLVYDETAKLLGIGKAPAAGNVIDAVLSGVTFVVTTTSGGQAVLTTNSVSAIKAATTATNAWGEVSTLSGGGGRVLIARSYGSTAAGTTFGLTNANNNTFIATGPLGFGTGTLSNLTFGTNGIDRGTIDSLGNFVIGSAALATAATDGFLYIPGGPGAPTGVPTAFAGRVPLYYDTTNNKFYIYNGGWKGGTAPGVFS